MPFCPKCESEYREGFDICADCGVALIPTLTRPAGHQRREEAYAEELFEEIEDPRRFCPLCLVEYVAKAQVCIPCGNTGLITAPADAWQAALCSRPLDAFSPPQQQPTNEGLEKVYTADSPGQALWVSHALLEMGIAARVANDSFVGEAVDSVGVWVEPDEVEAAVLLLGEDEVVADDDAVPKTKTRPIDVYQSIMTLAERWHAIGKRRRAMALCDEAIQVLPEQSRAFALLGRIMLELGHFKESAEAFAAACERGAQPSIAFHFAAAVFLTHGHGFSGPAADRVLPLLDRLARHQPRWLDVQKLMHQALVARGDAAGAAEVAARVRAINSSVTL